MYTPVLSERFFQMGAIIRITPDAIPGQSVDITFAPQSDQFARVAIATVPSGTTFIDWRTSPELLGPYVPNSDAYYGYLRFEYRDANGSLAKSIVIEFSAGLDILAVPVVSSLTAVESPGTAWVNTAIGMFVQGTSQIKCDLNGVSGIYGSTIVSSKISVRGVDYPGTSVTLPLIDASGPMEIVGTVTDSRGRTNTRTLTPTILSYHVPTITGFTVARCDAAGAANDIGTYVKVVSSGGVGSLINASEKNQLTWTISSRIVGATTWTQVKTTTPASLSWSASDILGAGGYSASNAYEFRLDCTDRLNVTVSILAVPTGLVTMSWSKNGVGIGKVWQQGALDVQGDIYVNGKSLTTPTYLAVDLNAVTVTGVYYQNANANATTANHYPVAMAGVLEVIGYDGSNFVNQRYTTYMYGGSDGSRVFNRNWYLGTWGAWRESLPTPGAWATYAPTPIGMTLGNGTATARWERVGRTVHLNATITFGTTSAITGGVSIPLPATCLYLANAGVTYFHAGDNYYSGYGYAVGSGLFFGIIPAGGLASANISATSPFAWNNGSTIYANVIYETA